MPVPSEPAHTVDVRRREAHMGGELISEPPFAPIALGAQSARNGGPLSADPSVARWRQLLALTLSLPADWLTPYEYIGDRGISEHLEEFGQHPSEPVSNAVAATLPAVGARQRSWDRWCTLDVVVIERAGVGKLHQQQRSVGAGLNQEQVASPAVSVRRGSITQCARRVSNLLASMRWKQDRMAPGRWADQHWEIGFVGIIMLRGSVGPECGGGRRPTTPCTGANWVSTLALPMDPSSACWRRKRSSVKVARR
jgi:hypothetical protein